MDQWRSLEEITNAFWLPEGSSYATARAELLKLLAEIHPDRTSGEFANPKDEERYHHIQSAIHFIDKAKNKAVGIVPFSERSRSVLTVQDVRTDEVAYRARIKTSAKAQYYRLKMRSAIIAGALAACLAFSNTLAKNPWISGFLSYADKHIPFLRPGIGLMLLLGILAATAVLATAWHRENRAKTMAEMLLTDEGIAELFGYSLYRQISQEGYFSSKDLVDQIRLGAGYTERWLAKLFPNDLRQVLPRSWKYRNKRDLFAGDPVLAQQAVDVVLERLELRGAIVPESSGAVFRTYRLSETAGKWLEGRWKR